MTWKDCALLKHNKARQKAAWCTDSSFPTRRAHPGLLVGCRHKLCQFCFCTSVTTATEHRVCAPMWFPLEPRVWGQMRDWTGGNGLKLKKNRSRLGIRRNSLLWVWWDAEIGCPEKLCLPHPESIQGLAGWSSEQLEGVPCPWQGAGIRWHLRFLPKPFYHSMKGEQKNAKVAIEVCTLTFLRNSA